jgi:hypothetical protein
MKNANLECEKLANQWKLIVQQRPSEMDFQPFGYPGISGESFGAVFTYWSETLNQLIQKTKPMHSDENQVADAVLTRIFRDLFQNITASQSNGVGWLLQSTPFLQLVADAQAYMTQCVEKRINLRKELFKFAEGQLNHQILSVEKAAPIATTLMEQQSKILRDVQSVDQAKTSADETAIEIANLKSSAETEIASLRALWTKSQSEILEISETVSGGSATVDDHKKSLLQTLDAAKIALGLIETQTNLADTAIDKGTKLIDQANDKLNKALQDINRQALAGAFTHQVEKIKGERIVWVILFLASIAWLLGVGVYVTKDADPKNLFDWHNLLKGLPFIAPAIWLGWVSVRQAGTLSKIQQDYAYKAATAVAFEGYKREVAAANDEALSKQLLETTVRNFGENPIRIYSKADDHAMPIEQLLATVKDDSTWARVIDLVKALKPGSKK